MSHGDEDREMREAWEKQCVQKHTALSMTESAKTRSSTCTRYRREQRQKQVCYTVCKPVWETKQRTYTVCTNLFGKPSSVNVCYTVCKPVWETKQRTYTVCKPVWETKQPASLLHRASPFGKPSNDTYTVCKPVWETRQRILHRLQACLGNPSARSSLRYTYKRVWETKQRTYTVCKPVVTGKPSNANVTYYVRKAVPYTKTIQESGCGGSLGNSKVPSATRSYLHASRSSAWFWKWDPCRCKCANLLPRGMPACTKEVAKVLPKDLRASELLLQGTRMVPDTKDVLLQVHGS